MERGRLQLSEVLPQNRLAHETTEQERLGSRLELPIEDRCPASETGIS